MISRESLVTTIEKMSSYSSDAPSGFVPGVDSSGATIGTPIPTASDGDGDASIDTSRDPGGSDKKKSKGSGSIQDQLTKTLNINVVSIVIGALSFVVIAAWVDTFRAGASGATRDSDEDRYNVFYRKLCSTFVTTLFVAFVVILIYVWYKNNLSEK